MLCSISYVQALWRQNFTNFGNTNRNILVEDLQGFFASTRENDVHVHELHIWHLHKIKTWVQVEFSNIEFDTLFLKIELEKKDYFSIYKYFVLQDQLHGVVYICIFI